MKKLEEKELERIVELKTTGEKLQFEVGAVEFQKKLLLDQLLVVAKENEEFSKELFDKYGDCVIDIATGEIKEKEQEETNG
jgi:hypothetical protein